VCPLCYMGIVRSLSPTEGLRFYCHCCRAVFVIAGYFYNGVYHWISRRFLKVSFFFSFLPSRCSIADMTSDSPGYQSEAPRAAFYSQCLIG
jgi:hypothetical protein